MNLLRPIARYASMMAAFTLPFNVVGWLTAPLGAFSLVAFIPLYLILLFIALALSEALNDWMLQ